MRPPPSADFDDNDPRIPSWVALSELYLDTDVTTAYDAIVRALASSSFSTAELREMLMYDVHPALFHNLLAMVGEWAAFDETVLRKRIAMVRRQPRWRRRISHLFARDIHEHWRALEPRILAARDSGTPS